MMNKWQEEHGSITMEAVIVTPFFITFVLLLTSFVQVAIADIALQSALSETTKQIAVHMYPMYMLSETSAGKDVQAVVARIEAAKRQYASVNEIAQDYAALIPDPILQLFGLHEKADEWLDAGTNKLGLALLKLYVNEQMIDIDHLEVIDVTLPSFQNKEEAFFGMTAQYKLRLNLPFIRKDVYIRKSAQERVWIGA